MFEYFDQIAVTATSLMKIKMDPLIKKVSEHYNEKKKTKWLKALKITV